MQRMSLLIFNLWHNKQKKKIRGYKTIQTFTKRIEDKTNNNNNNNNNSNNKTRKYWVDVQQGIV